ncbi:hypothetical protein ACOMHN_064735 [Nucella lapillus]
MIWKENSKTLIMLTNLTETGKKKCEQYWPEEGCAEYGSISVQLLDTDELPDFTIRTFLLSKSGQSKYVKQFHFTMPDHGVPRFWTLPAALPTVTTPWTTGLWWSTAVWPCPISQCFPCLLHEVHELHCPKPVHSGSLAVLLLTLFGVAPWHRDARGMCCQFHALGLL